jgi:putative ABC transport system permease protein
MNGSIQDLRYACRSLMKSPGFTAIAVLTLTLGIGANTAVFSLVDSLLIKPLPFADPARTLLVWQSNPAKGYPRAPVTSADFQDWRDRNQVFDHISAVAFSSMVYSGHQPPELLHAGAVSAAFFPALGVRPIAGRVFLPDEDAPGHDQVAVLSYRVWMRLFASDPGIVGQNIALSGVNRTIIGVMPRDFEAIERIVPDQIDLWIPIALPPPVPADRANHSLGVIAHLAPGIKIDQAVADMEHIAAGLSDEHPHDNAGYGVNLVPIQEQAAGKLRTPFLVLMAAVGFVLLIACANTASLLLARTTSRQKEIAVRAALGAGRLRLVRHFLAESLLLSLAGGALGLLTALWCTDLLTRVAPPGIARLASPHLDLPFLSFALCVAIVTGMLFGTLPALDQSSLNLYESLKDGSPAVMGAGKSLLRKCLVVAQIIMSLVLLSGAGLMIKTLFKLQEINIGFNPHNLLTMHIDLPESKYDTDPQQLAFFRQILDRLRAAAGVQSAAAGYPLPLTSGYWIRGFQIEGRPESDPKASGDAHFCVVSPGYFTTLAAPIIRGRDFTEDDNSSLPRNALISQTFARLFFPDQDPVGKTLLVGRDSSTRLQIIGIVGDIKQRTADSQAGPQAYLPYSQQPLASMSIALRSDLPPDDLLTLVRSQVAAMDPDQPITQVSTMDKVVANGLADRRYFMILLSIFAVLALALAGIGVFGLMSHQVNRRVQEIGVRKALGATSASILQLVLAGAAFQVATGIVIGTAGAAALTRLMGNMLFEVAPTDPATFAACASALAAVGFAAAYMPARRALNVEPIIALRYE